MASLTILPADKIKSTPFVDKNGSAAFYRLLADARGMDWDAIGRKITLRPDRDEYRIQVMRDLVLQKFRNHAELQEKLLATDDATLVEGNQWHDTFRGVCNGVGQNNLGQILMNVRGILRDERAMMERACEI